MHAPPIDPFLALLPPEIRRAKTINPKRGKNEKEKKRGECRSPHGDGGVQGREGSRGKRILSPLPSWYSGTLVLWRCFFTLQTLTRLGSPYPSSDHPFRFFHFLLCSTNRCPRLLAPCPLLIPPYLEFGVGRISASVQAHSRP